jgi:hypothetical protein
MKKNSGDGDSEDEEKPEEPQSYIGPSPVLDTKHRYFIGKDYSNPYERDFDTLEKFADGLLIKISKINIHFIFNRFYRSTSSTSYAMA